MGKNSNKSKRTQIIDAFREKEKNIAKSLIKHPTPKNLYEAFEHFQGSIFGMPETQVIDGKLEFVRPQGGTLPIIPSVATPQQLATINNFWNNLKKSKILLKGLGRFKPGLLTKPGTAPTTFNGQNIRYISSPKGQPVTSKFYTEQGSEYILTKDGFARRIKSPHTNVGGTDVGLHDWNAGTTLFTEGEEGSLFNQAFYKLDDFGFKKGTYGLVKQGDKAKIMLIDPKTNQWREAMLSDVYPTTVKQSIQPDKVLEATYSDTPKIGWNILEKTNNGWHPGSPVVYIEKQGGKMNILQFLKNGSGIHIKKENRGKFTDYCGGKVTSECIAKGKRSSNPAIRKRATFAANARKWKHQEGGTLTYEQWQQMTPEQKTAYNKNIAKSFLSSPTLPNLYNSVKAYFGEYAPKNPYLQTGIAPSPGMSSKALALLGKTKNAYNVEKLLSKKSMQSGIKVPVETIKDAIKTGDVPLVSTKIVEPIEEAGLTIREANPVMLENYISNPAERAAMLDFKAANPNVYVGKTKMPIGRPSQKVMQEIMYPQTFQKWLDKSSQSLKATNELAKKIVKSEQKAAKLNSVEQGYSKTRRSKDKIERAFEYTDARHANAGQSRVKKANEKWILDIIEKEGGPWESKLQYFRRKMADSEKGSIRYNNGKQGIKQLIEDYKKLRGYKKGGKAFVNGVSVLDSNPDAYKYVKKKIKKAADGGNSKNWFSGVGNWLNKNQNTISTIGSAITNGVGLIKQNSELSKAKAAKEKELDAKYNPNNLIDDSEIQNEVNNQISQLEQQNPDVHYGEVDKQNLYSKVRNQYLSQAKQYAQFAKTYEQQQYNQYISDAQAGNTSSLMNLIGNGISTGIGMLGNKPSNNTNSTTSTPTYQPPYKYDMMAPYKKDFTFKI